MAEFVEPIVDRIATAPAGRAHGVNAWAARRLGWALNEALLFPIVAMFVIGLAGNLPGELLSDTWLVLLGGREIVQHGLPSHDTLTIWTHGHSWVDQQWLAQLVFYGLYAWGGIKLALFGHVAAAGSAFTLAIIAARRRGGSLRSVCWLALPSYFLLIWGSWNARAQSLALVLFVGLVWLLIREAHAPSRRVYLALPLLVLWANVHGTVVTGALLVVSSGIVFALERRTQPWREWMPRTAALCIAPVACVVASPYATQLPGYYERLLVNPGFRKFVVEWHPTAPSFQTAPFYALAFLTVWLIGRHGTRLLRYEKVVLALTLMMALQTIRSVIWFTLAMLIIVPVALDGALKPTTAAMLFRLLNRALVAASLAGVLTAVAAVAAKPAATIQKDYPAGALAAVDRATASDPNVRIVANELYGDWLLLRRPHLRGRLAFDVRFELLQKSQLQKLVDARHLVQGWQRTFAGYGLFVLRKSSEAKLAHALLRQPGARLLSGRHGVMVISRPKRGA